MALLTPLEKIVVPEPKVADAYRVRLFDREFSFPDLKRLLGAADVSKAGERGAGLAAGSDVEREAARRILASLTLRHLYDHPLTDEAGRVDSVMRVNYDIDAEQFATLASLTVGGLKDLLLAESDERVARIGNGLTGVMASAVTKLIDVHELILVARKISRPTRARTRLGLPGTLCSRLQPNHPVDDLRGITLLVYAGLSMGAGDALIGVNPAVDTARNVSGILHHLDKLRRETGAPTQICVLGHVKTQLACLDQGAPVEIMFQSLAGTEATNLTEFDVTVELLDEAYHAMARRGPLRHPDRRTAGDASGPDGPAEPPPNFMYFETGQGSEYTYGKHDGIDMTTTEALCYGLARRYRPFMVNNVTGFIGPETHLDDQEMIVSNLQDHFMGKLLGLPMGMAPCYTLHSRITMEGQQMATQLLTAAGANYYMDVHLNTDRMLAYFDTSAHDDQALREIFGRTPAPDFLDWALERGIFRRGSDGSVQRGPDWGNPRIFCGSDVEFDELRRATPATYDFDHAGPRPADAVGRRLKGNLAVAREAIYRELDVDRLLSVAPFRVLKTAAADKESHLDSPEAGARLAPDSARRLSPENRDVQIVVSDGLSAEAVHANMGDLLGVLTDGLESRQLDLGQPILVRYGRVKLAEHLATCLRPRLIVLLIGERPGGDALAARSLSAYLAYHLLEPEAQEAAARFSGNDHIRFEYTVVSNIYAGGLPPVEAGSVIAEKAWQILSHQAAGNRLEAMIGTQRD